MGSEAGTIGTVGGAPGVSVSGSGIGEGVLEGVLVGRGVDVLVAISLGRRVRVGAERVGTRVGMTVSDGRGVIEAVLVGTIVSVGTNTVTTCSVSAAAVSRLETARSTMFKGMIVMGT